MAGNINKPKKPKSKRVSSRLRHKIEKASSAKQRKDRKLAKKNPEWRSKLKKDPGIPNLFPYKEQLLQEIEEKKLKKQEDAIKRRELAKAARTGVDDKQTAADDDDMDEDDSEGGDEFDDTMEVDDGAIDESNPMAALLASARAAAEKYDRDLQSGDDDMEDDDDDSPRDEIPVGQASSAKTYEKVYKQVVDQADVVLYVLDARDPEGTRSRDTERSIMAAAAGGKRLILLLNKIDLVPSDVLKAWLAYLRRSFPTLPIRASKPAPNAHTFDHKELTMQNTSGALFRALKAYAAHKNLKRAISVGVIGYPNVGKSSIINALLGRLSGGRGANSARACPAGAEAGVTTSIRSVKIDNKLTLLDSPGVIFPSTSLQTTTTAGGIQLRTAAEKHAHLVLLNVVPPKQIEDPVPSVTLLLRRLSAQPEFLAKLAEVYDLPALIPDMRGDRTTDFLVQVARKRGRLGKGGVPNTQAAAMTVVTDWRDGRIQGWTKPPAITAAGVEIVPGAAGMKGIDAGVPVETGAPDEKVIVTEWAQEFKLDGLWGDDGAGNGDAMEQ